MAGFNLLTGLVSSIGHQSHEAGVFDRLHNLALVLGTEAITLAGDNLKLPRHKFTEQFHFFIINRIGFFLTDVTNHN